MPKPRPWTPEYRQQPPYCVQIEATLGCQLRCTFCGINGGPADGPGHDLQFMSIETALVVSTALAEARQHGWNPRLEFARRGEPSMHPDLPAVIATFRAHNPRLQVQVTTNGGGLLRKPGPVERIRDLFAAGVNLLAIDDYESVGIGTRVRNELGTPRDTPRHTGYVPELLVADGASPMTVEWLEHPIDNESHPNHRYKPGTRKLIFLADPTRTDAPRMTLNNHAGYGSPLRDYPKPCVKPFREVGVNWDGSIDLCCVDWISEYRIGSLHERSLNDLWNDVAFEAARRYLLRGERSALRPCLGCDHPGYNTNWLPGKGSDGRVNYPAPTPADDAVIRETLSRGPVLRPAERAMTNVYAHLPPWLADAWDARRSRE